MLFFDSAKHLLHFLDVYGLQNALCDFFNLRLVFVIQFFRFNVPRFHFFLQLSKVGCNLIDLSFLRFQGLFDLSKSETVGQSLFLDIRYELFVSLSLRLDVLDEVRFLILDLLNFSLFLIGKIVVNFLDNCFLELIKLCLIFIVRLLQLCFEVSNIFFAALRHFLNIFN